ncbi:MAG: OmpH family outer membrane protein [Flavobacteriaceae bacterium]|nr:OmpH family outer membrane protein [Flavobacteriaceae bacterium]
MKKLSVLVILTILMASCTQSKIGYVDVREVMDDYDAAKSVEVALKLEQEQITKSLDSLTIPFQEKVKEFYAKSNNMSASQRVKEEQALQQEGQQIQQQQQQVQQYLQQKGAAEIEKLTKKIDSTVAAYASKNKYQMILATQGNGQVIYGDDSVNITEAVIDVLNAESELSEK